MCYTHVELHAKLMLIVVHGVVTVTIVKGMEFISVMDVFDVGEMPESVCTKHMVKCMSLNEPCVEFFMISVFAYCFIEYVVAFVSHFF